MIQVDYTVSDKKTFDLVHCFQGFNFEISKDDIQQHLTDLYPMFNVYIENTSDLILDNEDIYHKACNCGVEEEHICPFKADIHGDEESLCICCSECTHQCAMNI